MSWWAGVARWGRAYRLDIIWVAFVGINLAAMRLLPAWQTILFLAIWVSLTVIYGLRLWRLQPTILTVAAVTLATRSAMFRPPVSLRCAYTRRLPPWVGNSSTSNTERPLPAKMRECRPPLPGQ